MLQCGAIETCLVAGAIGNEMLSTKNTYITDGQSNDVSLTDETAKRGYKVCMFIFYIVLKLIETRPIQFLF